MRNNNRDAREGGTSIYTMAGLAVLVVLALLFMWAPWSGPRVADNSAPVRITVDVRTPSRE